MMLALPVLAQQQTQNQAPYNPEITVRPDPDEPLQKGVEYEFGCYAIDPNGDQVYHYWQWGDTTNTGWLGPFDSGDVHIVTKTFTIEGEFNVKVKAKDTAGLETDWTTLTYIVPVSHELQEYHIIEEQYLTGQIAQLPTLLEYIIEARIFASS